MEKEILAAHIASLEQLLFKPWEQGNNQLLTALDKCCSFYDDRDMTEVEMKNLKALRESIEDLYNLKIILSEMDEVLENDFFRGLSNKQTEYENAVQGEYVVSHSNVDLHLQPMVSKLEEIRKNLNQRKISTSRLISYISRKAQAAGHINY